MNTRYTKQDRKKVLKFISNQMTKVSGHDNCQVIAKNFNAAGLRKPNGKKADSIFISSQKKAVALAGLVSVQNTPKPIPALPQQASFPVFTETINRMYALNNSNLSSSLKSELIIGLAKKIK